MRQVHCMCVLLLSVTWVPPLLAAQEPVKVASRAFNIRAEVDDVILAGRGDILLLQMNKLGKVAIFDIATEQITGHIPLGGNDTLVAGTADSVILVVRDKKVIQRWALNPLKKSLTVALPLTEQIDGLAAGYAGCAPVMIMTRTGPRFLNPMTLKVIQTESDKGRGRWRPHPQCPIHVASSADGSTFAGWDPGSSPNGIRTLRLEGTRLVEKYEHESAGWIIPSADGSLLFTAAGVYGADLKPLEQESRQQLQTFPTLHPAYFIGVVSSRSPDEKAPTVSLYSTSDRNVLLTLDELPGLGKGDPSDRDTLSLSDRIIAHPVAKKLIVVDGQRTLLHILPLDVVPALDAKGIDYLFVESLPVTTASVGTPYKYAIKVVSKAGNVKFKLDSGPEGMTVSPKGVVRWDVPDDFAESQTSVIVSIEDGSKQSLFHAYTIRTTDRPESRER